MNDKQKTSAFRFLEKESGCDNKILKSKTNYVLSIFSLSIFSVTSLFFTKVALASSPSPEEQAAAEAASFVAKFNEFILFPTITLLSAVAFLVFLWGLAEYLFNASNEQARQIGVKHITYGIIGLVVMISAYAILSIAAATFGLDDELKCADDPSASGC